MSLTKQQWMEFLLDEYRRCRLWPGWKQMYDLHDQEDRDYYDMLDKLNIKDKLIMEVPNEQVSNVG